MADINANRLLIAAVRFGGMMRYPDTALKIALF
jgi:hypothetical protein